MARKRAGNVWVGAGVRLPDMTDSFPEPFDETDEIVGVTLVREDLRQLLVVAQIFLMDEEAKGLRHERLRLAMKRIGATASAAEWQPKKRPPE